MKNLDKNRDQFVVICAESPSDAETLMPVAKTFAERLRKSLMLLSCAPGADSWVASLGIPYVALKGEWKTAVDGLPTVFNAVIALTLCHPDAPKSSITHPRTLMKTFRDCRIAYLAIPAQLSTINYHLSTIALTIDHSRESKEKLIWASYFGRFFGSRILVYHRQYRDGAFRQRLHNNLKYLAKVYAGLNLAYELVPIESGNDLSNPDLLAVEQWTMDTGCQQPSLMIARVADRRDRDLGDLFATPPEQRLLRNDGHIPLLFLNQRDDLYILCD